MASVALTAFARQMLETAVTNGGGATYEQLRDFRRKTPTDQAIKAFTHAGLLVKRGKGYVITAAGLVASATGSYESKWANDAPTAEECTELLAAALAPKIATARALIGVSFVKLLTDAATARHKEMAFPCGRCAACNKTASLAELETGDAWLCKSCSALPGAAG
jgi:hypothetical protein